MDRPAHVLPSPVQPAPLPEVVNHTPWPAQYFQHVDPRGEGFHVLVCRMSYDLRGLDHEGPAPPEPRLMAPEEQTPLCEADQFLAEPNASSTLQESDFAPYKPLCDVLVVNVSAHAPGGKPLRRWPAGLRFGLPGSPPAIDKRFHVCGPRRFERGITGWRLGEPQAAVEVPLVYELAAGGPNLVRARDRLEALQQEPAPDGARRQAAAQLLKHLPSPHLPNPIGCGLAPQDWVRAQQAIGATVSGVPGPQIEAWQPPCRGQADDPVIGLGPIGRWWHPRLERAGTHDEAWRRTQWPRSPMDHDYRYWNCAPDDQQIDYPQGGEVLAMGNLLPAHELVAFKLPRQSMRLLVRLHAGPLALNDMHIDTIIVDVAAATLSVVRRACVSAREPVRKLELGTWGDDAEVSFGTALP
ncbi:MAG: DUF2169 domain-containing protein [Proteobacteria bacterium]|nr:DUF2169 domain-containing protein [Pseudomonadota bacterium]